MAVVEDVIRHRLELAGLSAYGVHIRAAASALNILDHQLNETGKAQLGMGIAAGAGALFLVEALHKSGEAAGEEDAVFKRATIGFQAHGRSFPTEALEEFSAAQEHLTGVSRESIASTAGLLGVYGATQAQAEELVPGILDIAAAMKDAGVSTESASRMVGRFLATGKVGRLATLGIIIDPAEVASLGRAGALAAAMQRAAGGAAETMKDTLPGASMAAQSALHALEVQVGKGVVPILKVVASVTGAAAYTLEKIPGVGYAIAAAMTVGAFVLGRYAITTAIATKALVDHAIAHAAAAKAADAHAAAEGRAAAATAAAGTAAAGAATAAGAGAAGTVAAAGAANAAGGAAAAGGAGALASAGIVAGIAALTLAVSTLEYKLFKEHFGEPPAWLRAIMPQLSIGKEVSDLWKAFGGGDKKKDEHVEEAKRHTELLKEQNEHLKDMKGGLERAVGSREAERALGGGRIARLAAGGIE